ncbi:hypothetical protein [Parashewanella tropica]|uniref:hypothetical protein n=1 Tax=Parashewanella tropica TaxID=2547970 RepID=UPI00105A73C5|nr:hypothetical protein [Parashewanella tropica]
MRLFNSIFTAHAVLIGLGILLLLPVASASAITNKAANKSASSNNTSAYTTQAISGLTERVKLLELPSFWADFRKSKAATSQLSKNPSKVFVLYKNISSDFSEATVTIGFDVKEVKNAIGNTPLPPSSAVQQLLPKGKYTNTQLIQGWSKIDYARPIESVVEINYLNSKAEPEATQLFVQYR